MLEPGRFFVRAAAAAGLALVFLTPPFQVADEPHHLFRAYQISQGRVTGEKGGGTLPRSLQEVAGGTSSRFGRQDWSRIRSGLLRPLAPEDETFVPFANTVIQAPAPYLPQALAIALARPFGAPPLVLLYLARLANLACAVCLTALAIRVAPAFRWGFALLGLMPMTIFQSASASPDACTTAAAFLFVACILNSNVPFLRLFVLAVFVVLSKQAYLCLVLLAFAQPGRWRQSIALVGASVVATGLWAWQVRALYVPLRPGVDPVEQARLVLGAPLRFLALVVHDYGHHTLRYFNHFVGELGWADTPVPHGLPRAYGISLLVAALAACDTRMLARTRVLLLLVFSAGLLSISGLVYLSWNAVGADQIQGIQGRYFLPLAPCALLALQNRTMRAERFRKWTPRAAAAFSALALAMTLTTVVRRYW
ncbi:MAG: DUF2142 domain-containing protein [Planctomycetaceae bacterium]